MNYELTRYDMTQHDITQSSNQNTHHSNPSNTKWHVLTQNNMFYMVSTYTWLKLIQSNYFDIKQHDLNTIWHLDTDCVWIIKSQPKQDAIHRPKLDFM